MKKITAAVALACVTMLTLAAAANAAEWHVNGVKAPAGTRYVAMGVANLGPAGIPIHCDVDSGGTLTSTGYTTTGITFHDCTGDGTVGKCLQEGLAYVTAVAPGKRQAEVWGNTIGTERAVSMPGLKMWFVDNCDRVEIPMEAQAGSQPSFANGSKNALKPSTVAGSLSVSNGEASFGLDLLGQSISLLTYE